MDAHRGPIPLLMGEGCLCNCRRVFWQGSTDHRGTQAAPGRTVTLHPDQSSVTWGVAFQLDGSPAEQQETLKYLEWREKQYDVRQYVDVFGQESDAPIVRGALVYIATPNVQVNMNWLGPAPLEKIAAQIATAHGPSGPNYEYLFELASAMSKMGVVDVELDCLARMVDALLKASNIDTARLKGPLSIVSANSGDSGQTTTASLPPL
eukprot:jgi/Botrbrau1/16219/Bobra.0066s0005.2